jgi:hypothetical protein
MWFEPKCCYCRASGRKYDLYKDMRYNQITLLQGYWNLCCSFQTGFYAYAEDYQYRKGRCSISSQLCSKCKKITVEDLYRTVEYMYNNKIHGYTNGGGTSIMNWRSEGYRFVYDCANCRMAFRDNWENDCIGVGVSSTPCADVAICKKCCKSVRVKDLPDLQREWYQISNRRRKEKYNDGYIIQPLVVHI